MLHRRQLVKRTGVAGLGLALAGSALGSLGAVAASAQESTLVFWDTLNDKIRSKLIEGLGTSFGKANNIAVSHRGWTLEELQDTLPRAVESNQGPDVAQVNNGESLAGPMARAGQILDLKDYDTKYKWSERFAPSLLARNRYTADGKTFGEGDLWGMSAESEIVGLFYNRKIFADQGLSVPTTVAELEDTFKKLRENGIEPLMWGNLDKWPAIHLFGELQGVRTSRDFLDDLIYRRKQGASFTDASFVDAATQMVAWNQADYFLQGYDGITSDDAIALFSAGGGAMLLQGSWATAAVMQGLGADAGFFLMPPLEAGGTVLSVGGVAIPYSITTNAKDAELSAAFIDSLLSQEAVDAFIATGSPPSGVIPEEKIDPETVDGQLYAAWNATVDADAVGHYLDWAAPGFYDVITGGLQELLAGKSDPAAFTQKLQDFYAASFS
ncbi:MAG: extracellular solute-binding protein [Thermomicrobiales bacterium]